MYVIRNSFVAKPGMATKLAAQLKEAGAAAGMPKYRVLTDMTGDFNRVVLEFEAESLAQFETRVKESATNEAMRAKMAGYTELWMTGSREILREM